jgi:hypothetical protein
MEFTIYPVVFQQKRGWNSGVGQLPLLGAMVGAILGGVIVYFDSRRNRRRMLEGIELTPEGRLPLAMFAGVLFPVTMCESSMLCRKFSRISTDALFSLVRLDWRIRLDTLDCTDIGRCLPQYSGYAYIRLLLELSHGYLFDVRCKCAGGKHYCTFSHGSSGTIVHTADVLGSGRRRRRQYHRRSCVFAGRHPFLGKDTHHTVRTGSKG